MKRTNTYLLLIIMAVFCLTFTSAPGQRSYPNVTKVDLGVSSLTLEPGESYTFKVTFEPEDPGITRLYWFNSDETVAALNGLTNTVTALTPGTATLMAESFDRLSYALCEVTVSGSQEKDLSEMIEGKSLIRLSETDRAKIGVSEINRSLDLLETLALTEEAARTILIRPVSVIADVREGKEDAESQRALALGMEKADPMKIVHKVSLRGTIAQLLDFVKGNEDLVRVFKVRDIYINPDPDKGSGGPRMQPKSGTMEEDDPYANDTTMLRDHAEVLSSLSTIHNMGFTGKGTTIAVLDTGLDKNHEQFEGRVIAENCFTTGGKYCKRLETEECQQAKYDGPCYDGNEDGICDDETIAACYSCEKHIVCESGKNSSYPEHAEYPDEFNHGSNVAGIAAGMDGLARDANIVSVNIQSEYKSPAFTDKENNPNGYAVSISGNDLYSALAWLLEIQDGLRDEGAPVSIINMSLGGGNYDHICDHDEGIEELYVLMQELTDQGILVAAAAGNEGYNTGIAYPACFSNVIPVSALAGNEIPYIVSFSNHNPMVEILAPGTDIHSAALVGEWKGNDPETNEPVYTCTGNNCYGELSGTSQATPFVSGSLAMLMEAFPGMAPEDYLRILKSMSTKTVSERNSNDLYENNKIDDEREKFGYTRPIVDFSNFPSGGYDYANPPMNGLVIDNLIVKESGAEEPIKEDGKATVSDVASKNGPAVTAEITDNVEVRVTTGNVSASGANADGIKAKVSAGDGSLALSVWGNVSSEKADGIDALVSSESGKLNLIVNGDVNAGNAGIVVHEENKGPLNILIPGTLKGDTVGIRVEKESDENSGPKAVTLDGYNNIHITVGSIELNENGNAVEYAKGGKAVEMENAVNYLIQVAPSAKDEITVVDENGDPWQYKNFGRNTAKLTDERVYFRSSDGMAVIDQTTGRILNQTDDGLFYLDVKNGGPILVRSVRLPKPNRIDFYRICDNFRLSDMPKTGFSSTIPESLTSQPLSIEYKPTRLTIQLPSIDAKSEIVMVPEIEGKYPVTWLGDAVGMLEGSDLSGKGITILTGHNHLNTTEAGPFALLSRLENGDNIMITDERGIIRTYQVYESAKISANGFGNIADKVSDNALILITCEDESPDGGYLNRRVVLAESK